MPTLSKSKKNSPRFLNFKTLSKLILVIAILAIGAKIVSYSKACRYRDTELSMPPELVNAQLILDSDLLFNPDYPNLSRNYYFFVSRAKDPDYSDYCSEYSKNVTGFIHTDTMPSRVLNVPTKADVFKRAEIFKVQALIRSDCWKMPECIDVSSKSLYLVLADDQGQTWLLSPGYLFNGKRQNSPKAHYSAVLKTADGKEQPFVPDKYFSKEDGLFLVKD
jgi:hypothetical protein